MITHDTHFWAYTVVLVRTSNQYRQVNWGFCFANSVVVIVYRLIYVLFSYRSSIITIYVFFHNYRDHSIIGLTLTDLKIIYPHLL